MNAPLVSFPHMGRYAPAFQALVEGCGGRALVPPPTTRRTIELGSRHAPEFVCLPFKINLGNYIEALELGAEVLLQAGRAGACRYGFYSEVQEQILRDLGFRFRMIHLFAGGRQFNYMHALRRIAPGVTYGRALRAGWLMLDKMRAVESWEGAAREQRFREARPGAADRLLNGAVAALADCRTRNAVRRLRAHTAAGFAALEQRPADNPVTIGIVGELFLVMDPRANLDVESKLGRLGARVIRPMCATGLIRDAVVPFAGRRVARHGRDFSRNELGAHANDSIGHAVAFARERLDGVVHLYPFTCMPEVSARSILSSVSRRHRIPVLSLSFSEQTGEAGLDTRIEAFVDMLERRRKQT